jgi:hypothetical protein
MGLNNATIGNKNYHQGVYKPLHPEKYGGDPNNIVYRSGLELKMCNYCDKNTNVTKWMLEGIIIPYKDHEGKSRRYYPDFYMEVVNPNNPEQYVRYVIEVKPDAETRPPKIAKTKSLNKLKSLEYQLKTYKKNVYKWTQALEWCKKRDLIFKIVTEKNIDYAK